MKKIISTFGLLFFLTPFLASASTDICASGWGTPISPNAGALVGQNLNVTWLDQGTDYRGYHYYKISGVSGEISYDPTAGWGISDSTNNGGTWGGHNLAAYETDNSSYPYTVSNWINYGITRLGTFTQGSCYVPPPVIPDPLGIYTASSTITNAYGFGISNVVSYMGGLLTLSIASGLGLFYTLFPYIIGLVIIGAIVYFVYSAFVYFRH